MVAIRQIADFLSKNISDPVPKYIFLKEIDKKEPSSVEYINASNDMRRSKWYRELADEQWEDGSWGRFHTQNSKAVKKQKFVTTESALRRARELSLQKDDTMIEKCIKIMERYVRGEETWIDSIEKQKDNGKGHLFCRPFLTAARINQFDPENPAIESLRTIVTETLRTAFASGSFDEKFWEQQVREYRVPSITAPGSMYGSMLLEKANCMEDTLQRQWLDYIWNIKNGIYYLSSVSPAEKLPLEDKRFDQWFSTLELLSGFSLFPDYMKNDLLPHLFSEVGRLMNGDVAICNNGSRYAESWRDKSKCKTDWVLRIARIIIKCQSIPQGSVDP